MSKSVIKEALEYFPMNMVISVVLIASILFFTKSFLVHIGTMLTLALTVSIILSLLRAAFNKGRREKS